MNQTLAALYALEQVDSALALATRQYHVLDPGRAEQAAAETARTMYDRLLRALHETEGDLKDSELELQGVEKKKKDYETKLYGGMVSNPKELQSMQEEIEALGRQRGRLEEKILTLMDQLEVRRTEEQAAKAQLEQAETALTTKQAEYKTAARALAVKIKALTDDRNQKAPAIPAALMNRYEPLRKAKQGLGIGRVENGICSACHTQLPLNLI